MATRRTVISGADLEAPLAILRTELHVPSEFPPEVIAEAHAAHWDRVDRDDATDVELVTLDPAGSRDLDQAFAIERTATGFRFHYAIADVAAFVAADGAMAAEAKTRGETLYFPDGRAPLYPAALSEAAASLLPDGDRPAVLWRLELDDQAVPTSVDVRRAIVRSRAQLDYATCPQQHPELAAVLEEVGTLREAQERARGGVSLNVPEQDVNFTAGQWSIDYRSPAPIEGWNAQLSLMTGMAAATLMIDAKVGLLRTMPKPDDATVASLRRTAAALRIDWPERATYPEVIRGLDATLPAHAAMLRLASSLFRGARYVAFDGTLPAETTHSAVAASYAHATAPLRRLADRFVSEICIAACAGTTIPEWARAGLTDLPHAMAAADQHAHQVDRAVVDLAETLVLRDRVGEVFQAVIVEVHDDRGEVQLAEPAVRARIDGANLPLGQAVAVKLTTADMPTRQLRFELA